MPRLRVETEMPLSTVTFPPVLDHSWSFTTSAVHARLQDLRSDGGLTDSAAVLEQQDEDVFTLTPSDRVRWTDGQPVSVTELFATVTRGVSFLGSAATFQADIVQRAVILRTTMATRALRELLASALFSLTPCIRLSTERHTSGRFAIRDIREGGRLLELARRDEGDESEFRSLELLATNSPREGLELLVDGALDLTRILGGYPQAASTAVNARVAIIMGLRSAPGESDFRQRVASLLDLRQLAEITKGAYVVPSPAALPPSSPQPDGRSPELLALTYADFYPNDKVAGGVLTRLGLTASVARALPYSAYLAGDVEPSTLRIDLLDTLFGDGADFSMLLQAHTTIAAGPRVKDEQCIVTRRAEIDWAAIRMEES